MMLKVGELAQRAGLTVRALHHYDAIGLLTPSARSDAGYRLYNRADIGRLHQIQALRRFGVSLADIATFLASPDADLGRIVDQQIAALDRQISQAGQLRGQLALLQEQLRSGQEPELAGWLGTLEMMTLYDRYFSKEELKRLPLLSNDGARMAEWRAIVAKVRALKDAGVPPDDARACQLAHHWMIMAERDTDGNPDFAVRINAMHDREPALMGQLGAIPELMAYVKAAFSASRLAIYEKYLSADEFAFMRANYQRRAHEWPGMVTRVRAALDAGVQPASAEARAITADWMELFCSYAGPDPQTHAKIRAVHAKEPRLMTGTWMTEDIIGFIRATNMANAQRAA
jgi:DNA-binding transcriptional MerR regulator